MEKYTTLHTHAFNHLVNNIKTDVRPSKIQGVGVFAIRDILAGENVFPKWDGETAIYIIPNDMLDTIPNYIIDLMNRYFINKETDVKLIRLFNGLNFVSNNISYCNSAWPIKENINITNDGIAMRDIKAGEEILEWYTENINLENPK